VASRLPRTRRTGSRSEREIAPPRRPDPRQLASAVGNRAFTAMLQRAPITGAPATGFDRLFAGDGEIIGEVVESGVTVRTSRGYAAFSIEAPDDPQSRFGAKTMSDLQYLACAKRPFKRLEDTAKQLRAVGKAVGSVNTAIAAGSPWQVKQVFVVNEASRLHFADGHALITIELKDFDSSAAETAAHEASHAVFESHSHPDPGKPGELAPDTLALRIADLFLRLAAEPFSKRKPPLKADAGADARPAGTVMVTDGLWSGGAATEGHPWDGPDEFFASAFGLYTTDPKLLHDLIAHYAGADASIKTAGPELLKLLDAVKDPKARGALPGLAASAQGAATDAIRRREAQASTIKQRLGAILDPAKLPPATVTCAKP
jgi:hypothetical protein